MLGAVAAALASLAAASAGAPRPPVHQWLIPFPHRRRVEMAAYSQRHYGSRGWRLRHPRVIVEHYAVASTATAVRNTFAPDVADSELHELPGTCSHFVVNARGAIFQLVPLSIRCRHTVGLNWTAIGIEHVGFSDGDVVGNARERRASLRLTRWLRCRYDIPVKDVIGHNESLSSPYHHERVARLRTQTHGDMTHATMVGYRHALRRLGSC
jgi:N-acetylmuramoyl-L-alanine amidase